MESIKNNNLNLLIFYIKRAIVYSLIEKDYHHLKEETEKMSISLYSLHKIIEKLNNKTRTTHPSLRGFLRNDEIKDTDILKRELGQVKRTRKNEPLISWKEWVSYVRGEEPKSKR